jgi:hypothetical protein
MATQDDELMAEMVVQSVRVYLERNLGPIVKRIEAVEKNASPESLAALLDVAAKSIKVENGAPGEKGEKGESGERGDAGPAGADGKSVSMESVSELVQKAVSEIEIVVPPGERGEKGETGERGADGIGKDGTDGLNGKDGKDFDPELIRIEAARVLPGIVESMGAALEAKLVAAIHTKVAELPKAEPGRDGRDGVAGIAGKDGERGLDGFGLDDFAVELRGDRTLVFKFARGEITKECEVVGTWPVDMGPFKVEEGAEYTRGDGVSYKGCWWIAQVPTKDVPGTSKSWRMAVKAGRDGKDSNPAAPPQREPMRLR